LKPLSVYIHIPYCEHKCVYCDFYSVINFKNQAEYLHALKNEIRLYGKRFREEFFVKTIFFGGGTPSLMDVSYIAEILDEIFNNFNVNEDSEITLETNPGTVSKSKLKEFRSIGINRLSVGVQSFDDNDLKFLTRIHTKNDAIRTVLDAAGIGFENISLDMIFNLPGQTKSKWIENLRSAVELPVKHISSYSLILERGTILNKWVLDGKVKIGDKDYDADLYEITQRYLISAGFAQYEVSNFAKQGFECVHNKQYWNYGDYLGLGTAAHSFINNKRWWNYKSLTYYLKSLGEKGDAAAGSESLNEKERLEEFVMLALRSSGLSIEALNNGFDPHWITKNQYKLSKFQNLGLLDIDDKFIRLTEKGYALCDEMLTEFEY